MISGKIDRRSLACLVREVCRFLSVRRVSYNSAWKSSIMLRKGILQKNAEKNVYECNLASAAP